MKNNTKKILAILLLLVIALVIAGIFILSSRLNTTASVAPTAPVSLPRAAVDNWGTDARCAGTFTVTAQACVPSGTVTCTPDCPTACGKAASTISTCTDSCGGAATKACAATAACAILTCADGPRFSDDFSATTLNTDKWFAQVGTGRTVAVVDGKLKIGTDATAEATKSAGITAANLMTGNFDASVDVESFTATLGGAGGTVVELAVWEQGSVAYSSSRLVREGNGAFYADHFSKKSDGVVLDLAADQRLMTNMSGKLFIQRRGSDVEAFVQDGTQKFSLGKHTVFGTGVLHIEVISWRPTGVVMSAVVDNFVLSCPCTANCSPDVAIEKKAYQNESGNSAGKYTLNTEIDTVAKNQTFVYTITVANNDASSSATGVTIKDPLTGENQDQLAFVDKIEGCEFEATSKILTCNTDLAAGQSKVFSFRVKVSDGAVNGTTIKNVATVSYQGKDLNSEKDLLVSTVVSCNHTCTTNDECSGGLTCDTTNNKCRNTACSVLESCVCPTAAAPRGPVAPREVVIRETTPKPTVLPETGILDFPGVAAFGGGLLLAIVGILLAL